MSDKFKWLQFFADGGASGGDGGSGGAGTGVTSADAGQNTGVQAADAGRRLEDLGVPPEKAEKFRQRMAKKKGSGERIAASLSAPRNDSAAEQNANNAVTPNMDFDTFMKIPENQQRLQSMMAERGKAATEAKNAAQEQLGKLAPLLELLGSRYSVEAKDGQFDLDAIIQAATDDDLFFEDRALERGENVEKTKSEWRKAQAREAQEKQQREQMLQQRFMEMQQQVPDVLKEYPNFDLRTELGNPEFVHLVHSTGLGGMGWDLRRAFRAVHQDEIEKSVAEAAARQSMTDAARVVQSGQARPRENGSSTAAVSATPNLKAMSHEERIAYMKAKYPPR